jgi:hypothetical protein
MCHAFPANLGIDPLMQADNDAVGALLHRRHSLMKN